MQLEPYTQAWPMSTAKWKSGKFGSYPHSHCTRKTSLSWCYWVHSGSYLRLLQNKLMAFYFPIPSASVLSSFIFTFILSAMVLAFNQLLHFQSCLVSSTLTPVRGILLQCKSLPAISSLKSCKTLQYLLLPSPSFFPFPISAPLSFASFYHQPSKTHKQRITSILAPGLCTSPASAWKTNQLHQNLSIKPK